MLTFSNLLRHFPRIPNPCTDQLMVNQCAIRMSIALMGASPTVLTPFEGNRCSHGHARSARALARFLRVHLGEPVIKLVRGQVARSQEINEGQGILFYLREPLMNHIDLWTTRMCLPRYGEGNAQTMSWTALDAKEYWFWPMPP